MWSWDRIRDHRQFFHEYKRLWVTKLTSFMLSAEDKIDIEVSFTIVIIAIVIVVVRSTVSNRLLNS